MAGVHQSRPRADKDSTAISLTSCSTAQALNNRHQVAGNGTSVGSSGSSERTAGVMASEHGEAREQTVELSEVAIKLVIEGVAAKLQEARGGESSQSGEPSERPPTRSGGEKK